MCIATPHLWEEIGTGSLRAFPTVVARVFSGRADRWREDDRPWLVQREGELSYMIPVFEFGENAE